MKKILLTAAILLMATTAFAKRPTGLNLGGGFANNFMCFPGNDSGELTGNQSFTGYFAEVGYNLKVSKVSSVYFGARLDHLFNGSIYSAASYTGAVQVELSHILYYLDIPVKYSLMVGGRTKFFFDLGPTVNFWLGARTRVRERDTYYPGTTANSFGWFENGNSNFNRVNLSLGGNIGVMFNHVKVYAGYDQGLFSFTKKDIAFSNVGQLRIGAAFVW